MILLMFLIVTVLSDIALVHGSEVFKYECLPKNGGKSIFQPF